MSDTVRRAIAPGPGAEREERRAEAESASALSQLGPDAQLSPAHVVALQRAAGNRAVAALVAPQSERVPRLQRGHTKLEGEPYEYTDEEGDLVRGKSVWALSDDLSAGITLDGELHTIPAADLHQKPVGEPGKGNFLFGALTIVHRESKKAVKATTVALDITIEPAKYEGYGVLHTEPTYFLMMLGPAVEFLSKPGVLAVILEIRQTNTPCASCQKVMGSALANIEARVGKPIIVRGSAKRLYESAPGKLGAALHKGTAGHSHHEEPANVADVHGIHKLL